MAYSRTTWENSPSEATPLSADNLNNIEQGILDVESDFNALAGTVGLAMGTAGTAVNTTATQGSVTATQGSVVAIAGTAGTAYNLTSTYGSVSSHVSATTSVHGITDTANLVYTNNATLGSVATLSTALTATQGSVTSTQGSVTANQVSIDTRVGILDPSYLQYPVWRYAGTASFQRGYSSNFEFGPDDNSYYIMLWSRQSTNYRYLLAYTNNNGVSFTYPGGTAGTSFPEQLSSNSSETSSRIVCSSNGSVIYVTFRGQYNSFNPSAGTAHIYKSINSGTSFTQANSLIGGFIQAQRCSSNGSVIYVTDTAGGTQSIISSRNGGATWSTASFIGSITDLTCSSSGSIAFATVKDSNSFIQSGSVLATTDGGLNWSNTSASNHGWQSVSCSSNGSVVIAASSNGTDYNFTYPIISQDSGSTWSNLNSAELSNWSTVRISQDGNKIVAYGGPNSTVSSINMGTSFYKEVRSFTPEDFLPSGSAIVSGAIKATFLY